MVLLGPLLLAVVSVIWAEEDYFIPENLNHTWDNARNYCQICYKDLTTMTPGNAHIIIQKVIALNLTSGYWIGLRENFSGPIPFSQWSNGAPVIYQNWYPGRPILKKPEVFVPTSPPPTTSTDGTTTSYDSTTTAGTTTHSTTAGTTTHSTTAGTTSTSGTTHTSSTPIDEQILCPTLEKLIACFNGTDFVVTPITDDYFSTSKSSTLIITSSPTVSSTSPSTIRSTSSSTIRSTSSSTMLSTSSTTYTTTTALITSPSTSLMTSTSYSTPIPETDYDYITDSCVALLSFGMWREKHCYESLTFICYDERFTGTVKISNVTHGGSVVTWDKAPGDNVDHYRVELHGSSINTTAVNATAVNTTKDNTTAFNTKVLTIEFQNLEAGKLYTVEVFPVKCSRYLNSLNTKFYTCE
ncbi:uncharacterized protein LOC103035878 [Astyanax mexicanus]|uniref:uncharacterized protein LOC103035878 n=1 Tax=Astyanax mexicanus TaxID=7994 RepID=UPI0020CAD786|nr:uncharacterized protein LOC103035878 [Astyanax mexicanus]